MDLCSCVAEGKLNKENPNLADGFQGPHCSKVLCGAVWGLLTDGLGRKQREREMRLGEGGPINITYTFVPIPLDIKMQGCSRTWPLEGVRV